MFLYFLLFGLPPGTRGCLLFVWCMLLILQLDSFGSSFIPVYSCQVRAFLTDSSFIRPRHIANSLWSFSQLQILEASLLDLISSVALDHMESFEPQSLASSAWALTKLNLSHPELWFALSRRCEESMFDFDARGLSNTAWTCATMRRHDVPLLEALSAATVPKLAEFDEQALSTTMWASAKLMFQNKILIDAMVLEILDRNANLH